MLMVSSEAMVCDSLPPIGKPVARSGNGKHPAIVIFSCGRRMVQGWTGIRRRPPAKLPSFGRDIGDHRLGDLVLAHDHAGRAMFFQVLDFILGMRARDDRKRRIEPAGLLHHLTAFERVGNRNQETARGRRDSRPAITSGSAALPVITSLPLPAQRCHPVGVILDHQQRGLGRQRRADEAADPAVADQHHMIGERRERNGLAARFPFGSPARPPPAISQQPSPAIGRGRQKTGD